MDRPKPRPRSDFCWFLRHDTRWSDNDMYGHVNNTRYYEFFDTAVNRLLIEARALDPLASPVIGLVVETQCTFFAPLAFPEPVEVGLAVARIGRSSITYEIGIFAADAPQTAAHGRFVHVYVDASSRRPVDLPEALKGVLAPLLR